MDDLAKALWVKLKLTGGDKWWKECIVCGAPTKLTYACQQTPDPGTIPAEPVPVDSPSGRNCWIDKALHINTVERDRLIDRRNRKRGERDTG